LSVAESMNLEPRFASTLDPFVCAQAAAARTKSLRVGSAISLYSQHDPISTAKRLMSLDRVIGGRLTVGVGGGWIEDEMALHGVDPKRRNAVLREHVEASPRLWTGEFVSYEGEYVRFPPTRILPRPVQQPGPPIYVAGSGPRALERVLAFGDGWMPDFGSTNLDALLVKLAELREAGERRGAPYPVIVTSVPHKAEVMIELFDAGVTEVATVLPSGSFDEIAAHLSTFTAAARSAGGIG
ncbi:MAG TPA: TIGR03619 family F420-dependent LLM class oxidoreductase, partial [Lentzea sp.]